MINKSTYTDFNNEQCEFNYQTSLSLSQKASFVMEVAGMIVSGDVGYAYILKDTIFKYCLIKYFTDIKLFENDVDFSLDMVDNFIKANTKALTDIIESMGEREYSEIVKACDEAIEFRKSHFSDFRSEISDLLQVVREFVVKPDYLNELLAALTNALNSFADKGDIDMGVVNKLADIVSVMKNMQSKEVAKAIIDMQNQNKASSKTSVEKATVAKPQAKRGRKPKTAAKPDDKKVIDISAQVQATKKD